MQLDSHLLYQKIIGDTESYEEILGVFIRLLEQKNVDVGECAQEKAARFELNTEQAYDAAIVAAFFSHFSPHEANEYINLGRKEKIARSILKLLNQDKPNEETVLARLYDFCRIPAGEIHLSTTMTLNIRVNLIAQFISSQLAYIGIAKNFINMRDIAEILSRSVSIDSVAGMVGGKSAGMILANRILRPTLEKQDPLFSSGIEEIDTFYIKSSVINAFIVHNRLEECHSLKYLEDDEFETERMELYKRFMNGVFPDEALDKFNDIIERCADSPLILRSSSFLEDSVGCSFTGKYESFFISNTGSCEERLAQFLDALKKVYFSLYSASAIQYRRDNELLDYNEKMSVLVQKVVGSRYGKYFFPAIGIVGFSRNPYCWNSRIKKEDGMLRMVMGLGTRAVDRVADDYPRIVSLSAPTLRPEITEREKIKYSQRYVDVLNMETGEIETVHFVDLINYIWSEGLDFPYADIISVEKNGVLGRPLTRPERLEYDKCAISFDGLLSKDLFSTMMKKIFKTIESAYDMGVDMEFAWHDGRLYVLQCRSLFQREGIQIDVDVPRDLDKDSLLFSCKKDFSSAEIRDIEYICYVDKQHYEKLDSTEKKYQVARLVGKINRAMKNKRYILMGPGRWGTTNVELGVGAQYGDINNTLILAEIAWEKEGITPELSYGTHFFQDLVEADIVPLPLFPDRQDSFFNLEFIDKAKNFASEFCELKQEFVPVIKVIRVPHETGGKKLHVLMNDNIPLAVGCFA